MKVRMLVAALLSAVLTASLPAQEKAAEAEKPAAEKPAVEPKSGRGQVERIVTIKNVDMMRQFRDLSNAFNVPAFEFRDLGILVLRGSADSVAAAQAAIQKYDAARPAAAKGEPQNVEVTAYLLLGGAASSPAGQPVPELLAPVVAQLKERFPYKQYELLESIALRVRGGDPGGAGHVSGVLPPLAVPNQKTFYNFELSGVEAGRRDADTAANVHIRVLNLHLEIALPAGGEQDGHHYKNTGIKTGLDIREGQKVVVGKNTLDGTNSSLILVLTVKVV